MSNMVKKEVLEIQRYLNRLRIRDEKGSYLRENGISDDKYIFTLEKFREIVGVEETEVQKKLQLILLKPILSLGDTNIAVRYLQWYLELKIDGIYTLKTEAAVIKFQNKNFISTDGRVGEETWGKIIA